MSSLETRARVINYTKCGVYRYISEAKHNMSPIAQHQTQWRWQYGDTRKLMEKNALKVKPL